MNTQINNREDLNSQILDGETKFEPQTTDGETQLQPQTSEDIQMSGENTYIEVGTQTDGTLLEDSQLQQAIDNAGVVGEGAGQPKKGKGAPWKELSIGGTFGVLIGGGSLLATGAFSGDDNLEALNEGADVAGKFSMNGEETATTNEDAANTIDDENNDDNGDSSDSDDVDVTTVDDNGDSSDSDDIDVTTVDDDDWADDPTSNIETTNPTNPTPTTEEPSDSIDHIDIVVEDDDVTPINTNEVIEQAIPSGSGNITIEGDVVINQIIVQNPEDAKDLISQDTEHDIENDIPVEPEPETVDIMEVHGSIPFSQAFAIARAELGPGAAFVWHGQVYGTYYQDEWNQLSDFEKGEFTETALNTAEHMYDDNDVEMIALNDDPIVDDDTDIVEDVDITIEENGDDGYVDDDFADTDWDEDGYDHMDDLISDDGNDYSDDILISYQDGNDNDLDIPDYVSDADTSDFTI